MACRLGRPNPKNLSVSTRRGVEGEPAYANAVVLECARNGVVHSSAHSVRDQGQRGAGVSDGSVVRQFNQMTIDFGVCGWELPEPIARSDVEDINPMDLLPSGVDDILIDITKRVKRLALIGIIGIAPRTQVGGEESAVPRDDIVTT